jgi:opacity protein-like surface antigen
MKRLVTCLFALSITVWPSAFASAQSVGAYGYVTFASMRFAASDSFELVTGSSSQAGFGVGGTFSRLWRGVFADVSFWQHKPEGQRVFVDGDTTYQLGIPVRITFQPIDLVGGWKLEANSLQPYVGGGVTFMSCKEESDFAIASDNVDERKTGAVLLVGVDVPLGRYIRVGGEYRYRAVSGVLGEGGVSSILGEDQLGGSSFAFRASVGR